MSASGLFQFLLRLGDTDLVLAQRLGAWCGKAPILEEDLALANVALDLLGQARLWLSYAGDLEGLGRDEDALAFLRDGHEFRNLLLVEQPNGNYADTMARQFLFDSWHSPLLDQLSTCGDKRIAAIAEKGRKECAYHLQRSAGWIVRLGDGTAESHQKVQTAINRLWMYSEELFATGEADASMNCDGASLRAAWVEVVSATFKEATLAMPSAAPSLRRGNAGLHTEHLGYLLAEMQFLQRAYPGAQW